MAELGPLRRRRWVRKTEYLAILRAGERDASFFDDVAEAAGGLAELSERWGSRHGDIVVPAEEVHDIPEAAEEGERRER